MGVANNIGAAIDSVVAVFSPRAAIDRRRYRRAWARTGNQYAAAQTTKGTGGWSPTTAGVNEILAASAPMIRVRVRQLVRDFPYFARAVNILVDYVVGEGIVFQSKVEAAGGELDHKKITEIEDAAKWWMDQADHAGLLHYYELMRLAKRQDAESGEFLFVTHIDPTSGLYLPYTLQAIESDLLTDMGTNLIGNRGTTEIVMGVEREKKTGRRVAYHFTDPDSWGRTVAVPASRVIHGYDTLRPEQVRGISPFAPGVLVADDLAALMDSELDATKMASKWLAMVTTADPLSRQMAVGTTTGDNGEKIEEIETAIIEYLRPGEEVTLASNPRPGANFDPFVRLVLCMFSITTGIPYELLSGDYQRINYSTGRLARNDFKKALRPLWGRHIRQFADRTIAGFFNALAVSGKVSLPGYYDNPARMTRREWQPPGIESNDPLRESKANVDDVNARLRSPQEIIKARGRDPEAVVREIKEFNDLCEKYGVDPVEVSTALANNPAAVENQKSDGNMAAVLAAIEDLFEGRE